ncbi:MAG: flagellar hook-basal body complex protein FliE [Verrucomicrobia bacterium]|nr:flagellar hook-basal body complex protein FliE [Verrucomicrobiota bacterium]
MIQSAARTPTVATFQEALAAQFSGQPLGQQRGVPLAPELPAAPLAALSAPETASAGAPGLLAQMVQDTQNRNVNARQIAQQVIQGDGGSIHSAMIAMEEASISFQMLVEMRNKVVESLQELMRMQI